MPSMTAFARFPCARTYRDDDVAIVLSENGSPGAINDLNTYTTLQTFDGLTRSACWMQGSVVNVSTLVW
jgi:hypothetical protein